MKGHENFNLEIEGYQEQEKLLKLQVEELTDFIENAAIPLHWVNGSGVIIWANKAELDMLGYTRNEYIGSHIYNFHANKEIIEDILFRLGKRETLKNYPARLKCKNGDTKPVLINSNVFWKGGEFKHTRCFTIDISDLKEIEEKKVEIILSLEEKNRKLTLENHSLKQQLKH